MREIILSQLLLFHFNPTPDNNKLTHTVIIIQRWFNPLTAGAAYIRVFISALSTTF